MKLDLRRIRERKLVEWVLAYGAGAWLTLEALALTGEVFEWPAVVLRLAFILLLSGVPVVLVLAWYHGEKGRQRASAAELTIIAAILVAGGFLVAAFGGFGQAPTSAVTSSDEPVSLAVLPFEALGGGGDDVAFADGMHDELLHRLSKIGALRVTSRTSVMSLRDRRRLSREIAELLSVRYLVEGTTQRSGDRVRVSAELIDPVTDDHLWSQTYSATLSVENLFSIQADISTAIAGSLAASLTSEERQRVSHLPTQSLAAYEAFQRGNVAFRDRFFPQARETAIDAYRRAAEEDPAFVAAHAQLARTLVFDFWFGDPEAADRVWEAVRTAESLDSAAADTHRALGDVLYYTLRDYGAARAHYERVLELEPSDAATLAQIGLVLNRQGRIREGVEYLERSLRIDPRSALYADQLGIMLGEMYDGAGQRAWEERALGLDPVNDTYRHRIMQAELCVNGDTVAARRFHESTEWATPVEASRALALLYLFRGEIERSERALADVPRTPLSRALGMVYSGDSAEAAMLADSVLLHLPDTLAVARGAGARYKAQQPGRPWSERGIWEALRGNRSDAVRWARLGLEVLSAEEDAVEHAWRRRDLIRVLVLTGGHEEALRQIEILMQEPSDVGPGCYRLHPLYRPLQGDPRLEEALALARGR